MIAKSANEEGCLNEMKDKDKTGREVMGYNQKERVQLNLPANDCCVLASSFDPKFISALLPGIMLEILIKSVSANFLKYSLVRVFGPFVNLLRVSII